MEAEIVVRRDSPTAAIASNPSDYVIATTVHSMIAQTDDVLPFLRSRMAAESIHDSSSVDHHATAK